MVVLIAPFILRIKNADAEKQMQIFKEYTELLDSKRDQSFKDSIPDLWRMLNE